MAGGDQYDVLVLDCVEVARYASAGWLLPIDDLVTDDLREDIIPFARQGMTYDGQWWGLPWTSEWKSFTYNDRMLRDAGYTEFPKTWDEVVDYSKQLQDDGLVKYATAFSWAQKECLVCDFVALAASFGGTFFDEDLNPTFNRGGSLEALQWMVDSLYVTEIVDPASLLWTEDDVDAAMAQGDIAYQLRWGTPTIPLNDPDRSSIVGEARIGLMPSYDGEHPYTVAGPMGWAISAGTNHPDEAWEFLQFMAGPEGSRIALEREGIPTGWQSVINDPEVQAAHPELEMMAQQAQFVANRPAVPWYAEFSSMFAASLHQALSGLVTPQEALDEAAAKAEEIKAAF